MRTVVHVVVTAGVIWLGAAVIFTVALAVLARALRRRRLADPTLVCRAHEPEFQGSPSYEQLVALYPSHRSGGQK